MAEGPNFYFGRDRAGNIAMLGELCESSDFEIQPLAQVEALCLAPVLYGLELVLASQSPRRHELLTTIGVAFRVHPADVDESWHADARAGLELEARLQAKLIGSGNQVEAIRANFEKRAPEFEDAK